MFGRKPRLSPLAARKQLLITESELNRVRLNQEWLALADEVGSVADRAKSFNGMAASIISLVAAVGAFTGRKPARVAAQSSWLEKIASGARLASSIWLMFRARNSDSGKK